MALTGTEVLDIVGTQASGAPSSVPSRTTTAQVAALGVLKRGTVTLNGATPVSVAYAGLTATQVVTFSLNTVGGTVGAYPTLHTVTPGTGFTVLGSAGDTSIYNWIAE